MTRDDWLGLLLAAVVTAGLVVAYAYSRAPEATLVSAGDTAPDLELDSLGGHRTRISNFRGKVVLLTMFLSGCKHCEADAPELEKLHRAYVRRGLVVLGVGVDPDRDSLRDFVERHQLTFYVLEDFDGRAVRSAYGSYKMPETYLIDATGRVDAVYLGGVDWLSTPVRERIEALLADVTPALTPLRPPAP
jgi:peroxiredoxin